MRLSYSYDLNSDSRQGIFESILKNNDIYNEQGNLYLDATFEMLYEGILQFAGCIQKVCNMRYWHRDTIKSEFYENLKKYTTTDLKKFNPTPNKSPLPKYDGIINVDWSLTYKQQCFYVFGVSGNEKAKNTAIALLEFQKANLTFMSLIVHENMTELGNKEKQYLIQNADKQYPVLEDFCNKVSSDIPRLVA